MENNKKSGSIFIWMILIVGLGVALWLALKPSAKNTGEEVPVLQNPKEGTEVVYDDPALGTQNNKTNYVPQNSENNPRQESLDPFTPHRDFETFLGSTNNKRDFNFDFGGPDNIPNYQLDEGTIDFKLEGTLKTGIAIEDNVSLNIEFLTNNQISFTKRKYFQSSVLPYIKETEKKSNDDKALYSFEFSEKLEVAEPGLYYYLIVPTGRNRVLYGGKFMVR